MHIDLLNRIGISVHNWEHCFDSFVSSPFHPNFRWHDFIVCVAQSSALFLPLRGIYSSIVYTSRCDDLFCLCVLCNRSVKNTGGLSSYVDTTLRVSGTVSIDFSVSVKLDMSSSIFAVPDGAAIGALPTCNSTIEYYSGDCVEGVYNPFINGQVHFVSAPLCNTSMELPTLDVYENTSSGLSVTTLVNQTLCSFGIQSSSGATAEGFYVFQRILFGSK